MGMCVVEGRTRRGLLIASAALVPAILFGAWSVAAPPAATACVGVDGARRGMIAPAILIEDKRFESGEPMDVFEGVSEFAEWALETAKLASGEFREEALFVLDVSDYYGEVTNGGHAQFVWNSFAREGKVDAGRLARLESNLGRIGARENQAIVRDLRALLEGGSPEAVRWAAAQDSYGDPPAAFAPLNARFFRAERGGELWERVGRWARPLPALKPLPKEALEAEMAAIANAAASQRPGERSAGDPCAVADEPR